MTFLKAWELYKQDKILEGLSAKTLRGYRIQINMLARYFGDERNINTIELHEIKQYLIEKCSHLKLSSLGYCIRSIRVFFGWAFDEGYINNNPVYKLKEPKLPKPLPKHLTEEEVEELLDACKIPLESALISFYFNTGCRAGEVFALNRNSINWEHRSCIVCGKGLKEREVYFSIRCALYLKKYLNSRKDLDTALFVTERAPHRIGIDEMRFVVKRVGKRTTITKRVCLHILRHSYAFHLMEGDAPLYVIQNLMGHAKVSTTLIYVQLSGKKRRDLYNKHF